MQWERKHIRMAKLIIIEVWRMWNIVWRDNRVQFPQQKMSLSYSLLNNTMSWRSQLLLTSISTQAIIICCTYSTLTQWQAAFVSRFPLFDFCHSSCCCCCYCMLLYRSCKMIRLKLIQCSNFNKSCFFGNFLFFFPTASSISSEHAVAVVVTILRCCFASSSSHNVIVLVSRPRFLYTLYSS